MTLVVSIVCAIAWVSDLQRAAIQRRIYNLLISGRAMEVYISVARDTHSRIIDDPRAIFELAEILVIQDCRQLNNVALADGGTAIYVAPVEDPDFRMQIARDRVFIVFPDNSRYLCRIEPEKAMRKAAEIADFAYPILSNRHKAK